MTMIDLAELFDKHNDEFLKFDRVADPASKRPDLCAFLLLDELMPGDADIVSSASHDEIWLVVDCEELAKVATEFQIVTLIRCGVRYDSDGLCMFV